MRRYSHLLGAPNEHHIQRPNLSSIYGERVTAAARSAEHLAGPGGTGGVMIAAIYARKSTDQSGVADEAKSVRRQIEHSREYAERKGWTVDESLIFVDDGISGAEFQNRPGFMRLMNSLKPQPPFQVLIMSEESRLGREAIDTMGALKELMITGVRVFSY